MQKDIEDAERVLDTIEAGEKLRDAMSRRHLGDVEAAVNKIKKKKLEKEYALELIEADKLMNKLRRLERLRREILELNQSTISEIRSYQKPPEAVHQVMIAVYLLLGYKEKELKVLPQDASMMMKPLLQCVILLLYLAGHWYHGRTSPK